MEAQIEQGKSSLVGDMHDSHQDLKPKVGGVERPPRQHCSVGLDPAQSPGVDTDLSTSFTLVYFPFSIIISPPLAFPSPFPEMQEAGARTNRRVRHISLTGDTRG